LSKEAEHAQRGLGVVINRDFELSNFAEPSKILYMLIHNFKTSIAKMISVLSQDQWILQESKMFEVQTHIPLQHHTNILKSLQQAT